MSAQPAQHVVVKSPFPSLTSDTMISGGGSGLVYFINDHIVFKCPWDYKNPPDRYIERARESAQAIDHEKAVHELLMKDHHPNIIRCILTIPEGFFMERMPTSLDERIEQLRTPSQPRGNDENLHARWVRQLASSLAWLESQGIVHGDLRPRNVLLTANDDIRITDFDTSVKIGAEVEAATEPFCRLEARMKLPLAGPGTEQFALASCIYNFRFGHIPLQDLDPPTRVQTLMRNELPSAAADTVYGQLIEDCWRGKHKTMHALEERVNEMLRARGDLDAFESPILGHGDVDLVAQCHEYLEEQKKLSVRETERKAARLRDAT